MWGDTPCNSETSRSNLEFDALQPYVWCAVVTISMYYSLKFDALQLSLLTLFWRSTKRQNIEMLLRRNKLQCLQLQVSLSAHKQRTYSTDADKRLFVKRTVLAIHQDIWSRAFINVVTRSRWRVFRSCLKPFEENAVSAAKWVIWPADIGVTNSVH